MQGSSKELTGFRLLELVFVAQAYPHIGSHFPGWDVIFLKPFFGLGKWLSFSKIYLLGFRLVDFYHEALQKVFCVFSTSLVAFRFL